LAATIRISIDRHARKMAARGRQIRLAEIAMHDAALAGAVVEHAPAVAVTFEHCPHASWKFGLDDERIGRTGGGRDLQPRPYQRIAQGPIDGEFNRHIPVSGAACTRVPAAVIGMKTEREDIL